MFFHLIKLQKKSNVYWVKVQGHEIPEKINILPLKYVKKEGKMWRKDILCGV